MAKKLKNRKLDNFIGELYKKHGSNVQVDIFDIGKITNEASEAYAAEEDPEIAEKEAEVAIIKAFTKYRKN